LPVLKAFSELLAGEFTGQGATFSASRGSLEHLFNRFFVPRIALKIKLSINIAESGLRVKPKIELFSESGQII
jgi:hypothetical protein